MDQKLVIMYHLQYFYCWERIRQLTDRQMSVSDLPFPHGAYSSWVQDDILDASICDTQANIVVKPLTARNLILLKVV